MGKTSKNIRPEFVEWVGMPRFNQPKKAEYKKEKITFLDGSFLYVRFENKSNYSEFCCRKEKFNFTDFKSDRKLFCAVSNQSITDKTKSIWFPFKSHWGGISYKYATHQYTQMRYPVYIVSKGRYNNGLTWKALDKCGVDYFIVCESNEADFYRENTNGEILVLPKQYLDEYETCDDLGDSKSKGPGAARNFCIDHSKENGFNRHWVMDDNLDAFHYLTDNEKYEVECNRTFVAAEDFVDRYTNVPVAGFNYYSFCKKTDPVPPFVLNTRIYSCLLIDNHSGYRWRGRYNEDTDLSLRVLKDGNCTIQFNAFLCGKVTTQRMRGGNSKEFYDSEGTLPKSKMIEGLHPDVAKVKWKFNRWHHDVNYKPFKSNQLKKSDLKFNSDENNYGLMKVKKHASG